LNSTSILFNFTTIAAADTTFPLVSIIYPTNTTYGTNITELNYSASDTNLESCWYSTNGGTTNISIGCTSNITAVGANDGSTTWTVWANDTANNVNSSIITFFYWLCDFVGTTVDESDVLVANATVFIINQNNFSDFYNTTSNKTGDWIYNNIAVGNYTTVGYDPLNVSRDGDADPHINCTIA